MSVAMDVQTGLVYVAVVIVSALVIGFVSIFAMKEKSYEEAIAEQRKLPDDLLLGKKEKVKEKKKKHKKKEEKEEKEEKTEHVKFEETPEILPPEPPVQENGKGGKKKGKVEKVKPILVNKDEPAIVISETSPSQPALLQESNHFDVTQPKDDLELIKSHSRENLHQISQSETALNKSPKETPTKINKKNTKEKDLKKKDEQKEEKKEAANVSPSVSANQQQAGKENVKEVKEKPKEVAKEAKEVAKEPKETKEIVIPVQSFNKESKKVKKKNDILAQIGGDKDGVTFSLLKPLVQKAELSRSEIQFLIDQLLNKQQDNPLENAEWTESRADPIIKLKKQLSDKEKALKDEQEASQSVQSKLIELRHELNSDRSRLRQLEEALTVKSAEAQTLHTRMQHILESHAAEKQGFSRQIEQLQAKIAEDQAIILKMQEEQGQSHGQMQQELIAQRKQLELQISQMRDNENSLKAQLAQKHAENQELQSHHLSISQELQNAIERNAHDAEDFRQQNAILQEQLMHLDTQLQDVIRQLKDSQRAQSDLEHRIANMHRVEQDLQKRVIRLQSERDAAMAETSQLNALREELEKVYQELSLLKSEQSESSNKTDDSENLAELRSLLSMKEIELDVTGSKLDEAQIDLDKAQSDVETLKNQLHQVHQQLESAKSEMIEAQDSCKSSQSDLYKCQEEIRTLQDVLSKTQAEFSKIKSTVSFTKDSKFAEAELQIIKLKEDNDRLAAQMQNVLELQKEVQQLREKNETLVSQLANSTQRPAVEGRENGIEAKLEKNSVQLVESTNALLDKEQFTALNTALSQKQKQLEQLNSQVESLTSEINKKNKLTSELQDDLERQRSKNDAGMQKIKIEEHEATKALLQRIFPEIKVLEKSHDKWITSFEQQAYMILHALKTVPKSDDTYINLENTNKKLEAMVSHYKQIIDDTEGMLNKLQNHIESEEKRWQAHFNQKENEVSNLRLEIFTLQTKLSSNNELQQRITELEASLAEVKSLKDNTKSESQMFHTQSPSRMADLALLEKLQEEKAWLTQQLQNESTQRAVMDQELQKLRKVVENSESNLAQEKKFVSQLQREISQIKNEVCVGIGSLDQSTLNGPSVTDTSKSEGGSGKK
ncbi:kinectin [Copidosoma floridanum]|uniref:kinectin n=1 Tax=Copidosoma floridanum TaxID=29053 RepID=UPI0006C9412E|nr:kinectin [Copidosoma floridanum]